MLWALYLVSQHPAVGARLCGRAGRRAAAFDTLLSLRSPQPKSKPSQNLLPRRPHYPVGAVPGVAAPGGGDAPGS